VSSGLAERRLGAYGLWLEGLDGAASLLSEADPSWPRLLVETRLGPIDDDPDEVGPNHASLRLRTGGRIFLDRPDGLATISTPNPLEAFEIVHPYLAPAAAVMSYWLGRESFHGGAIQVGDVAWGVIGDRDSGKSTLLAHFVEQNVCFAGPRSVDLRRSAAEHMGGAEELGVVGARERWRVQLDPVPPQLRLAGWIFLEWGELGITPVIGARRLELLGQHRGLLIPPGDPSLLLDLTALPSFVLSRPRRWDSLTQCADLLLGHIRGD
jgi:hypothetical protein